MCFASMKMFRFTMQFSTLPVTEAIVVKLKIFPEKYSREVSDILIIIID